MLVATLVNLVIVFIAFIFKPGGSGVGWQFGAFLALIAAIVAAAPYAIPQLRAEDDELMRASGRSRVGG